MPRYNACFLLVLARFLRKGAAKQEREAPKPLVKPFGIAIADNSGNFRDSALCGIRKHLPNASGGETCLPTCHVRAHAQPIAGSLQQVDRRRAIPDCLTSQSAQPLLRFSQRLSPPEHVRPDVADRVETRRHVPQRERARIDGAAFELLPRARRRHRCARPGRARRRAWRPSHCSRCVPCQRRCVHRDPPC